MLDLTITGDRATVQLLDDTPKQVRYAAMLALNNAAFAGMRAGRAKLAEKFDRPTRWTTTQWRVRKKASKQDLTAAVGWSDALANKGGQGPDEILGHHFTGGRRINKRFENRLQRYDILPGGMQTAPGAAAASLGMIDAHGNMKGSALSSIISALRARGREGSDGNAVGRKQWSRAKKHAARVFWAGKPSSNMPIGIYLLDDKADKIRPVIVFTRPGRYTALFDLQTFVNDEIEQGFADGFEAAYARAMATARQ